MARLSERCSSRRRCTSSSPACGAGPGGSGGGGGGGNPSPPSEGSPGGPPGATFSERRWLHRTKARQS
eukprot:5956130-Lingulodinium_polyedra.AAC.1